MVKIDIVYQGDKHSQITHGPSGAVLETDAPKDNNGRGESFSPTDLVAAALGSCMVTVMAISAEKEGIDMRGARSSVTKEMVANPRRISRLSVEIEMPKTVPAAAREKLEQIARTCPVAKSIHEQIEVPISFKWL
ncbi:OsmC family protein [soil metagenome]